MAQSKYLSACRKKALASLGLSMAVPIDAPFSGRGLFATLKNRNNLWTKAVIKTPRHLGAWEHLAA